MGSHKWRRWAPSVSQPVLELSQCLLAHWPSKSCIPPRAGGCDLDGTMEGGPLFRCSSWSMHPGTWHSFINTTRIWDDQTSSRAHVLPVSFPGDKPWAGNLGTSQCCTSSLYWRKQHPQRPLPYQMPEGIDVRAASTSVQVRDSLKHHGLASPSRTVWQWHPSAGECVAFLVTS